MLLKRTLFVLVVLAFVMSATSTAAAKGEAAPILGRNSLDAIPGRYIVVFQPGTPAAQVGAAAKTAIASREGRGGNIDFMYDAALNGFAGSFSEQAIEALSHNPNVEYIEADQEITIDTTTIDTTQSSATWGLDRIDQRNLPLNGTYTYNVNGS